MQTAADSSAFQAYVTRSESVNHGILIAFSISFHWSGSVSDSFEFVISQACYSFLEQALGGFKSARMHL